MAYIPTTFVDRSVEFPSRRKLTAVSGQADTFDVARAEGTVFAEGTKPDAANLNAEFGKIKTETDSINTSLDALNNNFGNIADTGWLSVTFNDEYQKDVGSLLSLTNNAISNYKQVKAIDLTTTHHIGVNLSGSNNNVYLHPSNSAAFTGAIEYRLRIHY